MNLFLTVQDIQKSWPDPADPCLEHSCGTPEPLNKTALCDCKVWMAARFPSLILTLHWHHLRESVAELTTC